MRRSGEALEILQKGIQVKREQAEEELKWKEIKADLLYNILYFCLVEPGS